VRANYVFDEFRDSPLAQSALNEMASDFAAVRAAGLKIIVRVMYSFPCAGSLEPCGPSNYGPTDAALPIVLNHIISLAPLWRANADIIAYLEMGFVGAWGEWHNSTNGLADGNSGIVNASSAAIVAQILNALPSTRAAVIRYPHQKQALFGAAPLTATEAFTGTPKARVGAHNDCLLAYDSGGNTYGNPYTGRVEAESYRQYLSQDNLYVPQGGETCSSAPEAQPYIQCPVAIGELARLRWSAINTDYQPLVISLWKSQGCYAEIAQRVGYRFRLIGGEFPTRAFVGGPLAVVPSSWSCAT
jgi:hypothetical protein